MSEIEKSVFTTSPMERHGDSKEGRKAAAQEASRMLGRYFGILDEAAADLSDFDRRMEGYDHAIEVLKQRKVELLAAKAGRLAEYRGRAQSRLDQAGFYCTEYLRAGRKDPPARHPLPSGDVVFKKQSGGEEWMAEGDDLLKIVRGALAQLPPHLAMALAVIQSKPTVKLSSLKKLLGEDGKTLKVTDTGDGEVYEVPIGVEAEEPGGGTHLEPIWRKTEPEQLYIVKAERREEKSDGPSEV